jgi:hypothetical protein
LEIEEEKADYSINGKKIVEEEKVDYSINGRNED